MDLPTLDLVYAESLRAEDAQRRRGDAVDAKAGLVLGFAGLLAGLAFGSGSPAIRLVSVPAATAAILALRAYVPRAFPMIDPLLFRDRYLGTDARETLRRLLDTRLDVLSRTDEVLDFKLRRLEWATRIVTISIAGTGLLGIVEAIQEVLT